MPKVKYKHDKGALHIGGGRFFYAEKTYEVSTEEWESLKSFEDLVEVQSDPESETDLDKLTVDKLKAMAKEAGIEGAANMKKADLLQALAVIEVSNHANAGEGKAAE